MIRDFFDFPSLSIVNSARHSSAVVARRISCVDRWWTLLPQSRWVPRNKRRPIKQIQWLAVLTIKARFARRGSQNPYRHIHFFLKYKRCCCCQGWSPSEPSNDQTLLVFDFQIANSGGRFVYHRLLLLWDGRYSFLFLIPLPQDTNSRIRLTLRIIKVNRPKSSSSILQIFKGKLCIN